MKSIVSKSFIKDNFLLESKEAEMLFYSYAKNMPIIDYHNHLSAKQIAQNKPIKNITEAWLDGDHYKWRSMRANGIDEHYITGKASNKDKFLKWAETVPYTLRNPMFHWTHLELKRYFNIDTILQPDTALDIYEKANTILKERTPAQLLKQMNVEVVCTTDDPADDLKYHKQISDGQYFTKVYPTFRSDALFFIDQEGFPTYIKKLESCIGFLIKDLNGLTKAINLRIDFFHTMGCRLSDYGITGPLIMDDFSRLEVEQIFIKFVQGIDLTVLEVRKYKSWLLMHLGRKYHEKNWVQQYHLGVIRNNNKRLQEQLGSDAGCDSIGDFSMAAALSKLFNQLDYENTLAKTITYNLNPTQNEVFASMMGNFNTAEIPGKMQWGAAWWYLDQKDGIKSQLNTLSNIGLLSRFVGMLTDSRSFFIYSEA